MVTESEKSKHDMLRAMRKHIRENGITDFTDFQDWCDENNDCWSQALDSGLSSVIEKYIDGRFYERGSGAGRWIHFGKRDWNMNLITMVPATARFIAQMRGMRRHIVANNVTEFAVFQNWCDENNERWAEALDSGCAIAIEKFIADWNGRADANRWKHAAQPDDNIWDNELK